MLSRLYRSLDLDLLTAGYLRSSCGRRVRVVRLLDCMGGLALAAGVAAWWGPPVGSDIASANPTHREMILAPGLFWEPPDLLRDVFAHELAHCLVGPSNLRARAFQLSLCSVLGDELPQGIAPRPALAPFGAVALVCPVAPVSSRPGVRDVRKLAEHSANVVA